MSVEKKCAVVTGASRGIGRAIALRLAQEGYNLVINYIKNEDKATDLVEEVKKTGVQAIAVQGDTSDFNQAGKIIEAAVETFWGIYLLVNNAGITRDGLIARMKEEDFDTVVSVNLKGAFNCIRHCVPVMMKKREGRIINISSIVGVMGNAGQSNYAASKAGIIGLTKSVARELGARNITCNAIAPGFIETDMTNVLSEQIKSKMLENIPLKRFGKTEDVANLVAFLADEKSSYITGQVINVDGGMAM